MQTSEFIDLISNYISFGLNPKFLCFYGDKGCGKTSIITRAAQKAGLEIAHFDVQSGSCTPPIQRSIFGLNTCAIVHVHGQPRFDYRSYVQKVVQQLVQTNYACIVIECISEPAVEFGFGVEETVDFYGKFKVFNVMQVVIFDYEDILQSSAVNV